MFFLGSATESLGWTDHFVTEQKCVCLHKNTPRDPLRIVFRVSRAGESFGTGLTVNVASAANVCKRKNVSEKILVKKSLSVIPP